MMCKLIRLHHFGISHSGVKEMPSQMGHLLQKLSNYRAGMQSGTRVGESSSGGGSGRSRGYAFKWVL